MLLVTLTNTARHCEVTAYSHQSPRLKLKVWKHFRRWPFQAETYLYMGKVVVWCYTTDKLRTDVFGVIFNPPSPHGPRPPLLFAVSSNLGLIVSVIKHSCTDPSLNPLSSADYKRLRWLFSLRVQPQNIQRHGSAHPLKHIIYLVVTWYNIG